MQTMISYNKQCVGRKRKYPWEKLEHAPYCFVWNTSPRKNQWDNDRRRIWAAGRSIGVPVICHTTDDKTAIVVTKKQS